MDLLRLATAGSVDDGKSTLIGRLLYDAKAVLADQLAHVEERSVDGLDLALLTDGLRAEREQGITIDVAYRSLRHAAAALHPRRLPRPRPVHAQHGHRRVDGRPRAAAGRRARRADRAVAPPRHDRRAAADPPRDRRRQQDGPGRLRRGALRRRRAPGARARREGRPARDRVHPDQRAEGRQRRRALGAACPGTPGPPLLERLETIPVEPPGRARRAAAGPARAARRGRRALGGGPARGRRAEGRRRGGRAAERDAHPRGRGARRRRHGRGGRGAADASRCGSRTRSTSRAAS